MYKIIRCKNRVIKELEEKRWIYNPSLGKDLLSMKPKEEIIIEMIYKFLSLKETSSHQKTQIKKAT